MKFQIGDTVECAPCGKRFKVNWISEDFDGMIWYSGRDVARFPESVLCLVEEPLKVGDLVEVIGPKWTGTEPSECCKIFRITGKIDECKSDPIFSAPGFPWYKPSSLRKLSPEEVAKLPQVSEIGKIHERLNGLQDQIDKLNDRIERSPIGCHEDVHKSIDKQLSAIENRQGSQQNRMDQIEQDAQSLFESHRTRLSMAESQIDELKEAKLPDGSNVITIGITDACGAQTKTFTSRIEALDWCKAFIEGRS